IRLELLPYLERHFNPRVEQTLARTAQVLSAEISYLEAETERLAAQVVRGERLERYVLARAPLALQRRVVRTWLGGLLDRHPGFEQVEQAIACLTAPNRTRTAPLAGGYLLEVRFEWLVLCSNAPPLTD
ncbi:MAG: TilS substrate-binding domain-containing protein, partial [Gemmatimonadaceae bacterium]|nr:TilS substrate-binding domain-containing protein [Gloeobacterales cyanobacterium ES-bin-141]